MSTTIKTQVDETKKFVRKYQLVIACSATAAAAAYVTRKTDIRIMKEFAYDKGYIAGENESVIICAFQFITDKGLWQEFADLHGYNNKRYS